MGTWCVKISQSWNTWVAGGGISLDTYVSLGGEWGCGLGVRWAESLDTWVLTPLPLPPPQVHFFNSFFYDKLRTKGYEGVKRWTKNVSVAGLEGGARIPDAWLLLCDGKGA